MDTTVTPEHEKAQEAQPAGRVQTPAQSDGAVRKRLRAIAKRTAKGIGLGGVGTLQIESALLAAYTLGRSESQDGGRS